MSETGASPPAIPPGTFRIDREGAWRHEGVEVTHPGVLRNLWANLRVEGDLHYLQVGPQRIAVEVEDAPFVVLRLAARPAAGALDVQLSDGSAETVDPDTLGLDARGVPYCRVKGGRFRARLSVAAWLQVAAHVQAEPGPGGPTLVLGERRIPLRGPAACGGPA